MKHLFIALIVLVVTQGALLAEEGTPRPEKNLCLLDPQSCPGQGNYDLITKITRLKAAIRQGTKVYTPQELALLEKKLAEALEIAGLLEVPDSMIPQ